jgi:hypothetical protein
MSLTAMAIVAQTIKHVQSDADYDDDNLSVVMDPPIDDSYELSITFDSQ